MNTLVIAAHPDDEVLGCGGTIARLADNGHKVTVLILGEGITSRDDANAATLGTLHEQAHEVGRSLGAAEVVLTKLPDNRFDTVPLLDIVKLVEQEVARTRPQTVYTQHGGDLNIDHQRTFRAVLTAVRPQSECCVHSVYAYEVASSSEWAFQKFEPVFRPNSFVDISETLERKLDALQRYESEVRPFPHPRSPEALRAQAARWGSTAGMKAAEAFQLVWHTH